MFYIINKNIKEKFLQLRTPGCNTSKTKQKQKRFFFLFFFCFFFFFFFILFFYFIICLIIHCFLLLYKIYINIDHFQNMYSSLNLDREFKRPVAEITCTYMYKPTLMMSSQVASYSLMSFRIYTIYLIPT